MTNNVTPPVVERFVKKSSLLLVFCITLHHTHTHKPCPRIHMKKQKKSGRSSLDREHKDVTCAVRLPKTMYDRLCQAAEMEKSSLSDIIREGLIEKMDKVFEEHVEKELQQARIRAEIEKLGLDPDEISKGALGALLRQETGS